MEQKKNQNFFDIRGKYSHSNEYNWIIPYLSGNNSLNINKYLFSFNKYFKKKKKKEDLKKKKKNNIKLNIFNK